MAPYCDAQAQFIKSVRSSMDDNAKQFLQHQDWRNIQPKSARYGTASKRQLDVSSFYVKSVACFVPHIIIPGHVPICPRCESSSKVDTHGTNVRWIKVPKTLFGLSSHRYLDTKFYYCGTCRKCFAGYDKRSMQLSAKVWLGYFPLNLSDRFAVDDELYSFIISCANDPTSTAHKKDEQMVTDKYYQDYQYYLYLVRIKRIRSRGTSTGHSDGQLRIDRIYEPGVAESTNMRKLRLSRERLVCVRRNLQREQSKIDSGLPFQRILDEKNNRNNLGARLPHLGVAKLRKLIEMGITTGKELLESDDPYIKWRWKQTVSNYFESVRASIADLKETEEEYTTQMLLNEFAVENDPVAAEPVRERQQQLAASELPPTFSKLDDSNGYNGKVLSWSRINAVLRTQFAHRKPMQDSKLRGLKATMLKIDFQYKLAKKIRLWKRQGESYRPFTCIVTVLNEHGLCVYWRALKSSESMKETEVDLKKLDKRLAYNAQSPTSTVLAVWIDNCCTVSRVEDRIVKIFPFAEVKLDPFHWMYRWDDILEATTSKESAYFKAAMRRAMFAVNEEEFERARDVIQEKKGRRPTTKEILVEARATIPRPDILRSRVQKVLGYFMYLDSVANAALLNGEEASKWPRFFKPVTPAVRHLINRQMHQIDNGCLSDPTTCDIHIANASTSKHFVARGTSLNETANRFLNALLGNSIGIDRADRLLNCFFEAWNNNIQTKRLGAEDFGTVKTEVLALLNSLADGAGFSQTDLPFPTLSVPKLLPNRFNKVLGLEYDFPHADVSNPFDAANNDHAYPEADGDLQDLLENINWDSIDDDISIHSTDEEAAFNDDPIQALGENIEAGDDEEPNEELDQQVEHLHLLVLDTKTPETSMQSFARLTKEQPWTPFRLVNSSTPKTALDLEEEALFNWLSKHYKRHVSPGHRHGYKDFELAWNIEVAERFRKRVDDADNGTEIVLVNCKSYIQLQQHYDDVIQSDRLSKICDPECGRYNQLTQTLQQTRRQVQPPTGRIAENIVYRRTGLPTPYGAPTTFNPAITGNAILHNTTRQSIPWNVAAPPVPDDKFNPLANFKRGTWCVTCGFRKANHLKEESFGSKCKQNYCAHCMQLKEHDHPNGMGPRCTNEGKETSPYIHWYHK